MRTETTSANLLAADVLRHCRHFQRRQIGGNGVHYRVVVVTLSFVEELELGFYIRRILTCQARQRRCTQPIFTVATGAGWQTAELVAMIEDVATNSGKVLVLDGFRRLSLALKIFAQFHHLVSSLACRHVGHGGAFAFARLEIFQLLGNVLGMLTGQLGKNLTGRFAVFTVAQKARA